ncbi:MAG: 2-C-methyl-D-erythritol 2,4-cyclodiphosphate synthase [Burkholderiales bacterium]|jgi:2-C-methyl-D-erythritol 2,4-cyclodiphosphate synthase|nr:2-C-methyl-D-erythritol 2,4-cyclodiphosphate synthase [Burkholderiales bacterium]MBT5949804.1 2-C-methyl-D-erythritol 2,4-cyclodiphosphate synthase [Betaproteobacteria bacterium]MBL6878526.1 2-C-methyl-D-erythritol 2,4-cyclodiphosphate synthase [Burkholderiales bacterium]MCH1424465.1 2-C-methyl-D-erythritol 2,4-cyclodiphosphate synthase [Burkholderiales bacterium]MDA9194636.1 2-C-methyl-D-erythritol 2,4-cyclodiphosphate synthase [Burkholderiales bacterium]
MRIGEGFDLHALVPNRPLVIGGVNIPHEKGLLGHSDADVLIHALIDALLGACGLGDIGQHFPDTDPKWKGVDSKLLLHKVYKLISGAGYQVVNIDSTIIAERPKLLPFIPEMRDVLSDLVGVKVDQVNIKAKTSERLGAIGREECVVATVTVLLSEIN